MAILLDQCCILLHSCAQAAQQASSIGHVIGGSIFSFIALFNVRDSTPMTVIPDGKKRFNPVTCLLASHNPPYHTSTGNVSRTPCGKCMSMIDLMRTYERLLCAGIDKDFAGAIAGEVGLIAVVSAANAGTEPSK